MILGRTVALAAVLAVVGLAIGYHFYVTPTVDTASSSRPVDAVIALGGPIESAQYAESLVKAGVARHLVLSHGFGDAWREQRRICASTSPSYDVTCFVPDPSTTRGEAQAIGRIASQEAWDHVIVVVPTYHVSRTRLLVQRCYPGRLDVVTPDLDIDLKTWAYQYAYQTAGFAKALAMPDC